MKARALVYALLILVTSPANAGTKVWGLAGWGPNGWSEGVYQIAQQARTIPGVTSVHVYDYTRTQRVYDEILAAKSADPRVRVAIYGYSCGANSAVLIANSIRGNINEVLGMQPSIWCGGGTVNQIYQNTGYGQATIAGCLQTLGLGCQQWSGARRLSMIERDQWHGQADTDPAYQQDVLSSIAYLAGYVHHCDPARHHCHAHTLIIHRTPTGELTHTLIHHGQ